MRRIPVVAARVRIPTQSGGGFRFEADRLSRLSVLLIFSPQVSNCGTPASSMIDEELGMPAKQELSMRQLRNLSRLHLDGVSARDWAASGHGAQHDPGQSETGSGSWLDVAVSGRRHRRRSRTPAL